MQIGAVSPGGGSWSASPWAKYPSLGQKGKDDSAGTQQQGALPQLTVEGDLQTAKSKRVNETGECETCKNRKYQDGSDDPGVSFKTPTALDPDQAAGAVRSHEMEHVGREQSKAAQEDRDVVYQAVTYHTAICPECGRAYVSGGTTRTVTRAKQPGEQFQVGMNDSSPAALDRHV